MLTVLSGGLCVMQALNFEEGQPLSEVQIVAQAAEQAMAELDRAITNTMRLLDSTGGMSTSVWAAYLAPSSCAGLAALCSAQHLFLPVLSATSFPASGPVLCVFLPRADDATSAAVLEADRAVAAAARRAVATTKALQVCQRCI